MPRLAFVVAGQARGFLAVEHAQLTTKARRKLDAGDHVRVLCGKQAELTAVVIGARQHAGLLGSKLKYRLQLAEAKTQFDAAPSTLCYAFEGWEHEPLATLDERGIAAQCKLTLTGSGLVGGDADTWHLGVDSRAASDEWFTALLRQPASARAARTPSARRPSADTCSRSSKASLSSSHASSEAITSLRRRLCFADLRLTISCSAATCELHSSSDDARAAALAA